MYLQSFDFLKQVLGWERGCQTNNGITFLQWLHCIHDCSFESKISNVSGQGSGTDVIFWNQKNTGKKLKTQRNLRENREFWLDQSVAALKGCARQKGSALYLRHYGTYLVTCLAFHSLTYTFRGNSARDGVMECRIMSRRLVGVCRRAACLYHTTKHVIPGRYLTQAISGYRALRHRNINIDLTRTPVIRYKQTVCCPLI